MLGRRHKSNNFVCGCLTGTVLLLLLLLVWADSAKCQQDDIVNITKAVPAPEVLRQRPLRLPNSSFPLEYHVHITSNIHLGDKQFKGNVTIDLEIRETTDEIVLHATNLSDFRITAFDLDTQERLQDLTYTYDSSRHFLIIHAQEYYQIFEVDKKYRLEILYNAVMYESPWGLYWLAYMDPETHVISYQAATQFEPTSGRLAIPCYDEPAFKANFSIRLTHGKVYNAISNMPMREIIQHNDSDLVTTVFHTTPPISTYLVAFVISSFDYISETHGNITHRVFTPTMAKDKGEYQLKFAVRTVAAIEEYLGIGYVLDKLDHVALNKNYGAAMENWGLITYREDCLLYEGDDLQHRFKDTITIVHEIVHQWFGNLVSPEWWSYAWLNEGFATYFAHVIIDKLHPEFNSLEYFLMDTAFKAYSFHKYRTLWHPMTHYVEGDRAIVGIFDVINYQKAACVIKMFHHAFGQQTFMRGIQLYLTKYQYTVVNELDLFMCLQQALEEDEYYRDQNWIQWVPNIMMSWTHSKMVPIVKVIRNYEDNTVTIRQQTRAPLAEHLWIPLNFASATDHNFSRTSVDYFMLPRQEDTLKPEDMGITLREDDWLIVNKQQTGFYHVLYDDENLRRIARALQKNHLDIHGFNRADIFQCLQPLIDHNEIESIDVIFELLIYLNHEEDLLVWNYVHPTVDLFEHNLDGTSSHEPYKQFVRHLIGPIYRKYFPSIHVAREAITERNGSEHVARQNLLKMACAVDFTECLEYARQLAFDYVFHKKDIVITKEDYYVLTETVLCFGLRYLEDEEFNSVLRVIGTADRDTLYYDDVINGLRCAQDPRQIRIYLDIVIGVNATQYMLNQNDSVLNIKRLCRSNVKSRQILWQYISNNYKTLIRQPYFVDVFNVLAEYVPTQYRLQFRDLHQKIALELKSSDVNYGTELIELDSKYIGKQIKITESFLDKFGSDIHDWLIRNQQPAVYAASTVTMRSNGGANRFGSMLRLAGNLYRKLFSRNRI